MIIDTIDFVYENVSDKGEVNYSSSNKVPIILTIPIDGHFECIKSLLLLKAIGKKYGIIEHFPMVNNNVKTKKYFFTNEQELIEYSKINFPKKLEYIRSVVNGTNTFSS